MDQKFKKINKEIDIDLIKPYWKNSKKGTNIEKVKESIKEFGYNSLIQVDSDNIIINGHSRYKALKELGYDKIEVVEISGMSKKLTQKYRIIDNKVSEANEWDMDNLRIEIRELGDISEMQNFFDDLDLDNFIKDDLGQGFDPITNSDIDKTNNNMGSKFNSNDESNKDLQKSKETICPHCLEVFELRE